MRLRQGASGTLALVDFLGIAVEADLYGPDRQPGETRGNFGIEALTIGFDLETYACRPSASASEKKCGTTRGSPPHSITYGTSLRAISAATRMASTALNSSGRRLPGAESVQQCRQQRSQSRVICQETNSGARRLSIRFATGCGLKPYQQSGAE